MKLATVTNEYLKKALLEVENLDEETQDELIKTLLEELRHSSLILAGNIESDKVDVPLLKTNFGKYAMLFTDIAEFKKVFPDFKVNAREHTIDFYMEVLNNSDLDGFIVNLEGEFFVLPRGIFDFLGDAPEHEYPSDNSYTSDELKQLKDSINNSSLEEFIKDPSNIARYEELFDEISKSTLLTLRLSKDNVDGMAENGIISMAESGPIGFLHMDTLGGNYATVFTSEEKISNVNIALNKYSQIVNFSQMTNFLLNDDMDGIIINPNSDNILLTREVLLEYSNLLEKTCNNHKLNSAIFHMFLLEA